jgi:pyruvate/2-oxoglutarate dehydrogenase complex dihydrolipoamide dehydrogenase (E3) component
MDPHEHARLSHVHPPDWVNPQPRERYDLVVIGGGTAGLVTAIGSAGLGASVALVEQHWLGGDCLNVGCVPSKALLRSAKAAHHAQHAGPFGVAATVDVSFTAAMERVRRLRAQIAPVDGAPRVTSKNVDVFLGHARFTSPDTVRVDGAQLRFKRACLATGTRPAIPPIPGLAEVGYLTNETVFELRELPRRLVVLGGGPIGVELAQAFRRLGSDVDLLESRPRILPKDDEEAAGLIAAMLRREGVRLQVSFEVQKVERVGQSIRLEGRNYAGPQIIECDAILVAAGRQPNVEELGLDVAGVQVHTHGIVVDDRLRTTSPRIYAAGDVASPFRFTHAADAMARMVIQNALFFGRKKASALVIPWATYTDPEVAHVGLTPPEAEKRGLAIDTYRVTLDENDRAILDGETEGFVKIHVRKGTDRIVGATIVAPHAGDLIAPIVLAMTKGLGLGALGATILPYPTQAMVLKRAADEFNRTRLTPRAAAFLRWLLRWLR